MSRARQNRRFRVAITICMVLGLIEAAVLMGVGKYFDGSGLKLALAALLWIGFGALLGMVQWFMPYAIIVLGLAKLFEQKKEALEALGDDNVVKSDPDGERKLHEYLTAIGSTEARIGLLQRSDPYIPPEHRAPEGVKPPRVTLSRLGWNLVTVTMLTGAAAGAAFGMYHGLGAGGDNGVALVQLIVAALVGVVLASPVGVVLALVFGRIEQEEPDDAGRSSQRTA
jgi:hypothetical protein